MFTNITIGKYIYKDSLIHKINPLIKVLAILLILLSSIFFNLIQNILLLLVILIMIYISKIDKIIYLKNIYGFRYFLIGILIIYILSRISIVVILNNLIKIIINLLITSLLLYTTTLNELNYGLNILLKPLKYLKVNYNKISIIIIITIKFIFMVFEETDKIFKAFKNRGLKFDGNIKIKINKISMFLSTLFYLLLKKSNDISNTLMIRNCDLEKLVKKDKIKINYLDILFIINIVLIIILIIEVI